MAVTARKGRISKSTYTVAGATLEAINQDIERRGPVDPGDHRRHAGLCVGSLTLLVGANDFAFASTPDRSPPEVTARLAAGTVTSDCEITLPRLGSTRDLSPAALREWNRFLDAVDTHENGHVDACFAEAQVLARELSTLSAIGRGRDERAAQAAAQRALVEAMKRAYGSAVLDERAGATARNYDARTRHGVSQGAVLDARIA